MSGSQERDSSANLRVLQIKEKERQECQRNCLRKLKQSFEKRCLQTLSLDFSGR